MSLGTELRKHRENLHLSLQDAADLLGLSKSTIHAWEQGSHTPKGLSIDRIKDVYHISDEEYAKLSNHRAVNLSEKGGPVTFVQVPIAGRICQDGTCQFKSMGVLEVPATMMTNLEDTVAIQLDLTPQHLQFFTLPDRAALLIERTRAPLSGNLILAEIDGRIHLCIYGRVDDDWISLSRPDHPPSRTQPQSLNLSRCSHRRRFYPTVKQKNRPSPNSGRPTNTSPL